jgi:hypothetical protein
MQAKDELFVSDVKCLLSVAAKVKVNNPSSASIAKLALVCEPMLSFPQS